MLKRRLREIAKGTWMLALVAGLLTLATWFVHGRVYFVVFMAVPVLGIVGALYQAVVDARRRERNTASDA